MTKTVEFHDCRYCHRTIMDATGKGVRWIDFRGFARCARGETWHAPVNA